MHQLSENIKSALELLAATNITRPPIPVERIARFCGAQIRYESFEGEISGLLYTENNKTIIGVNSYHSKTRQRFTIAHELGHLILHRNNELHVDRTFRDGRSSQATDWKEIEANNFAAELLMPRDMIMNDLRDYTVGYDYEDDKYIQELARRYEVSLQAMIFRLINLGFIKQT